MPHRVLILNRLGETSCLKFPMKNVLALALVLLIVIPVSYAQEYKRFKVAVGVSLVPVPNNYFDIYSGFYLEPAWRWNDNLATGLHLAIAESNSERLLKFLSEEGSIATAAFTVDRYWKLGKFRPFYGLMAGASIHTYLQTVHPGFYEIDGETYLIPPDYLWFNQRGINLTPKVGFNCYRFRMQAMYQLITHDIPDMFTLQMGIEIGGGRKNKSK